MKNNFFTKRFKSKTSKELESIINNSENYTLNAIKAATWLLESRGATNELEEIQIEISEKTNDQRDHLMETLDIPIKTASGNTRLLHFIIDTFILVIAQSLYLWFIGPINEILLIATYPTYYILFENKFQQTLGKMVTDTIVIDNYGNKPSVKSIILRTAARYIPFEAFSCFGYYSRGWHDKMTNTNVIYKSDLNSLKKILKEDVITNA